MLTDIRPIHTINARGNIFLEVMQERTRADSHGMLLKIQNMRREVETVLAAKNISYDELRSALVPSQKRREIALIFDTSRIKNSWYGREIFNQYMPIFKDSGSHSVLVGDYSSFDDSSLFLLERSMNETLVSTRGDFFQPDHEYFVVYVNNLSDAMMQDFDSTLCSFPPYIGFADMTHNSNLKMLLSTMLVNCFIKHGKMIIQGHEDDRSNTEDINLSGMPFESMGYVCRSLVSYLEGPLLTYKIECPVMDTDDVDTRMALNSVNPMPLPLGLFEIEVTDAKANYIRQHNTGAAARAGLTILSDKEICDLLRSKIDSNYIYRLEYNSVYNITKFNVIIEISNSANLNKVRLLAALALQLYF